MTNPDQPVRRQNRGLLAFSLLVPVALTAISCSPSSPGHVAGNPEMREIHVSPSDNLQEAVDRAGDSGADIVILKEGTYRPHHAGQALLVLTGRHDGLRIQAEAGGNVVLTAENASLADEGEQSFPAVVNHVVLTGHGVTSRTILQGLTLTGANGFVAESVEALRGRYPGFQGNLPLGMFFYLDGGAVKVFGNSAPQFLNCEFTENRTRLCGAGVSIEQQFKSSEPVRFRNCVFRDNHCPATGAAVDVLSGGLADFENCLFVGNIANTGMDEIARTTGLTYNQEHGSGALTVFPQSRVHVRNCTFTANWNGVDDHGSGSVYEDSIFWMNDAWDGSRPGQPYELDVLEPATVLRCLVHGRIDDLRGHIAREQNTLGASDPQFDEHFQPRNPACQTAGFRPDTPAIRHQEPFDAVTENPR